MNVLIINQDEVAELLSVAECIDVMAYALAALARGEALLPLRPIMWLPDGRGALAMMPSFLAPGDAIGLKVISIFPGNLGTEFDSHPGAVLLIEATHGQLLAILDASEITAIRTAAVSGLTTRLLAREDADDLALLGSGVQARTHLAAMLAVRPIRRVRVWSRTPANARAFAERESARHGIEVEATATAREAVAGATLICTVTASAEPVLYGEWVAPGAHINAAGSSTPAARELDTAAVAKARLFVDRRESTVNEAGDFLIPRGEGAIDDSHIAGEIGDLLLGRVEGRRSADEITLFKSLGLAIEDLAAARYVYSKAVASGVGVSVDLGGSRR